MKNMRKFDETLANTYIKICNEFLNSSDREMEPYVRKKIEKFLDKTTHTTEEVYNFCDEISKLPVTKLSETTCVGDISTFMQSVFNVSKYYEKIK
jgi:hypothetical protein